MSMMGGNGSMTLGDWAPVLIGVGVLVVAVVAFMLVRMYRRSS